jgi:hypothetical protein
MVDSIEDGLSLGFELGSADGNFSTCGSASQVSFAG